MLYNIHFSSIRNSEEDSTTKSQDDNQCGTVLLQKSADIDNHNELSDLIQDDENSNEKEDDSS